MSDQEWLAYLDTLPPELADALMHTMERVNTVLNRERSAAIGERQALERALTTERTKIADLRTIVKDLFDQLADQKAVNDASNAAGPTEP